MILCVTLYLIVSLLENNFYFYSPLFSVCFGSNPSFLSRIPSLLSLFALAFHFFKETLLASHYSCALFSHFFIVELSLFQLFFLITIVSLNFSLIHPYRKFHFFSSISLPFFAQHFLFHSRIF